MPINSRMRRFLDIVIETVDHRQGDKERMRSVVAKYRDALARLRKLKDFAATHGKEVESFVKSMMEPIQKELEEMRYYIRTYNHFQNVREDDDTEYLFDEGLEEIKYWFEGWKMHVRDGESLSNVLRAFRAVQKLFPNQDMTLYRVVAVEDARVAMKQKEMQTGPRSLQSWTLDARTAKWFFQKQYAGGETMVVHPGGTVSLVDMTEAFDWVIVQARIPGRNIMWTPTTFDRLISYDMHATDSKLYCSRISDNVEETLYKYRREKECIVYIPGNRPIPVQRVMPLHIRAEVEYPD